MDPLPLLGRSESNRCRYEEEHQAAAGTGVGAVGPAFLVQPRQPLFAHPPPPSSPSSSARQSSTTEEGGGGTPDVAAPLGFVEKEHMFDKVVTPSDVGKLNRLVIPKQHAERYFPLDAASGEKGLLLNFEDRTGKQWRFRYSYWNSSQSYVMTKGWSRFVKEKRLDAGDTVSFGRGVGAASRDRLFIDWKHRPEVLPFQYPLLHRHPHYPFHGVQPSSVVVPLAHSGGAAVPWGRLVVPPPSPPFSAVAVYDHLYYGHNPAGSVPSNPFLYLRSAGNPSQAAVQQLGGGSGGGDGAPFAMPTGLFSSVPPAPLSGATAGKTLRLFGVNLDCSPPSEGDAGSDAAVRGHAPPPALLPPLRTRPGESPGTDQHPMDQYYFPM